MKDRRQASDDWPLLSHQHQDQNKLIDNLRTLKEMTTGMQESVYELKSLLQELKAIKSETKQLKAEIDTLIEKLVSNGQANSNEEL